MTFGLSLVTSMITLLVMYLAGNGDRRAWWLGIANQGLWGLFILDTGPKAYGLIPLSISLLVMYVRNLRKNPKYELE